MKPISTSLSIIDRIEKLNKVLDKENHYAKPIRMLRHRKIKEINLNLSVNWQKLHLFYPDLKDIKDTNTFKKMIRDNVISNRMEEEKLNIKARQQWKDFVD